MVRFRSNLMSTHEGLVVKLAIHYLERLALEGQLYTEYAS